MRGSIRRLVATGLAASAMTMGLAVTTTQTAASAKGSAPSVATWAEVPQLTPNYIFPFLPLRYFGVTNSQQFQYLMYRPLYWFANGSSPTLNSHLSLANAPTYSNGTRTVTIHLKGYKWANGEAVSSADVAFWMNMLHAAKTSWANYSPGAIPDNVKSISVTSPTTLSFKLRGPVNPAWFTSNQLSQITPLPLAWDVTAAGAPAGSGGCASAAFGTADSKCTAVFSFVSKQAGYDPANPSNPNTALATYATNPMWQVVDGPWKLSHFDSAGNVTMVPNTRYSGPTKPSIKEFREVPFATESAEFNALKAGSIDVGYLSSTRLTASTTDPLHAGANNPQLRGYSMSPLYTWSINSFPYNFNSTGDGGAAGPIFRQLYFRQAFQSLVNQPLFVSRVFKGYAAPTYGPIPVYPSNPYATDVEKSNPYPFSVSNATAALRQHGWTVVPNGTSSCARPGRGPQQCGAGIPKGALLNFTLEYESGNIAVTEMMNAEKAAWSRAGINVTLTSAPFSTVVNNAVPCTQGQSCAWELENWGGGWVYSPDYFPSGEPIYLSGAPSNAGSYSNKQNDANIMATISTNVSLSTYENYLARQLPVVFQPNQASVLTEIKHGLAGVTPQSPFWSIEPENWRF